MSRVDYAARGLAYSSFSAVSILSFIIPAPALSFIGVQGAALSGLIALPYIWGGLLFIGSISCLFGVLTRTWVGEYIGLGAVIICVLSLALAQIVYGVFLNGIMSIGLATILMYRWHLVRLEKIHAITTGNIRQEWYHQDRVSG